MSENYDYCGSCASLDKMLTKEVERNDEMRRDLRGASEEASRERARAEAAEKERDVLEASFTERLDMMTHDWEQAANGRDALQVRVDRAESQLDALRFEKERLTEQYRTERHGWGRRRMAILLSTEGQQRALADRVAALEGALRDVFDLSSSRQRPSCTYRQRGGGMSESFVGRVLMPKEPDFMVNGTMLNEGQALTLRVALETFVIGIDRDGLGDDKHGREMKRLYLERSSEILRLMHPKPAP